MTASRYEGGPGRSPERGAQHEVLDRVAGQHHLREGHQVGPEPGRVGGAGQHRRGIPGKITYGRVHLGEGDPERDHLSSVTHGLTGAAGYVRELRRDRKQAPDKADWFQGM